MNALFILRLTYLSLLLPLTIFLSILFIWKREEYSIRKRGPVFVLIFNAWSLINNSFYLSPFTQCTIVNWIGWLAVPFLLNTILFRCVYVLLQFRIQEKMMQKLKDEKSKQRKFSFFMKKKNFYATFIICSLAILIFPITGSFFAPNFYSSQLQVDGICDTGYDVQLQLAVLAIYLIAFVIIAILMRKVKENLLIKLDLVLCAILGIIYLILISVLNFKLDDPLIKNTLNRMVNASIVAALSTVSVIIPLYLLWRERERNSGEVRESPVPEDYDLKSDTKSFADMFEDKDFLDMFQQHLQKEFALENLLFLKAVKKYREMKEEELHEFAEKIQRNFIVRASKTPVNISGATIETIIEQINNKQVNRNTFDLAYQQIYDIVRCDAFPRFMRSFTKQ